MIKLFFVNNTLLVNKLQNKKTGIAECWALEFDMFKDRIVS